MRILLVAMPENVHLARWTGNLAGLGWDVHLFPVFFDPSIETLGHPLLTGVTLWDTGGREVPRPERDALVRPAPLPPREALGRLAGRPVDRAAVLARLIQRLRPDVVHSLEFQHAGYTTLDAFGRLGRGKRPVWVATNYGSDIYLFGRLPEHAARIRRLLAEIDVYVCECGRDLELARSFGFAGVEAPLVPMGGGWHLDAVAAYRAPGPTSARRTIALKAYEGWAGRAGTALEALRRCGDRLAGYTLELYLATPAFFERARALEDVTGARVIHVGGEPGAVVPYEAMLALHGRSRLSVGLSISDAISISLLEAMVMGSYPVQSWTGCGNEWLEDGVGGSLVPPEDPEPVAAALRRALTDDPLVDRAAVVNAETARERLAYATLNARIVGIYELACDLGRRRRGGSGGPGRAPTGRAAAPAVEEGRAETGIGR